MPESQRPSATARTLVNPADPENLRMARGLARGVRADFNFEENSDEERELEATAYLVLVEYAARFDPVASFRAGALRAMVSAIRRYRAGNPLPPAVQRGHVFSVAGIDVGKWTRATIRRLTRRRIVTKKACVRLAMRVAADYAAQFDLGRAFRGWCSVEVRSRCRREAARLRNGGTYHTTRPGVVPSVGPLPRPRCANCIHELGMSTTWVDSLPKWSQKSSELDEHASQHRIANRKPLTASRNAIDRRPALEEDDPDEPWSPCDTTPDE